MKLFSNLVLISFLVACTGPASPQDHAANDSHIINPIGKTISSRFNPPNNYHRKVADTNSFTFYLQQLPLKSQGSKVHYFNGQEKRNTNIAAAVIDISVGDKDLQQCADAVIRLRADYLRASGREDEITFNFTNGSPASWISWKNGYRCNVQENDVIWEKTAPYSDSDQSYKNYLETVFIYAGSLSLEKELVKANHKNIQPGDVFIRGGSPGHAIIVVDVVENDAGEKLFLLAQSYMPAQDIHVLVNPNDAGISPWYRLEEGEKLYTPEWTFEPGSLKRFR